MTNTKLSPAQRASLTGIARHLTSGKYSAVVYNGRNRTEQALESRGLIRMVAVENPTHGRQAHIELTVAGWAWLKENEGIERPADAGRLTLAEALADTTWVGDIAVSETEYAACLKSWAEHGTVPGLENDMAFVARVRKDLDRVDVPREDGETDITYRVNRVPMLADEVVIDTTGVDATGTGNHLTALPGGVPANAPAADTRLTLEEALSYLPYGKWTDGEWVTDGRMVQDRPRVSRACRKPGCGLTPAEHTHWAQGHLYQGPPTRDAGSVDVYGEHVPEMDLPRRRPGEHLTAAVIKEANEMTERRDAQRRGDSPTVAVPRNLLCTTCKGTGTVLAGGQPAPCWECVELYRDKTLDARYGGGYFAPVGRGPRPDDLYVDRAAWRSVETQLSDIRSQLARVMDDRKKLEKTRTPDVREPYTHRGDDYQPVTYKGVPVPADLAAHWSGIEAISWARGVTAGLVKAQVVASPDIASRIRTRSVPHPYGGAPTVVHDPAADPTGCDHEAWEAYATGSRRCEDCGEWLPAAKPDTGQPFADAPGRDVFTCGNCGHPYHGSTMGPAAMQICSVPVCGCKDELMELSGEGPK